MKHKESIPVITLDGPSGTGKGTLCHQLASALGWHFLDSGAIYRVLAYVVTETGLLATGIEPIEAIDAIVDIAHTMSCRFVAGSDGIVRAYVNDKDVSLAIRTEQVGQFASKIATIPEIRSALLQRQRDFAEKPGLVTDGRDMGTVVFPNAMLKIYLFASDAARAERRYLQLKAQGIHVSLAEVQTELQARDARDMGRAHSPLKPAEDAVLIDTTGLTIVQVFENILQLARARLRVAGGSH